MISHLKSYLAGKAVSYFVNAEMDAADSLQVIALVNKSPVLTSTSPRIKAILKYWPADKKSLVIAAYSLYYHNGFTDHVYARLIARPISYQLPQSKYYPNTKINISDLFFPWSEIFFRLPVKLKQFCRDHSLPTPSCTRKDVLHVTKTMQRINISVNEQTIKSFTANKPHPKKKLIQKFSLTVSQPEVFVKSAIHTQQSAIFWDKIYFSLINYYLKYLN